MKIFKYLTFLLFLTESLFAGLMSVSDYTLTSDIMDTSQGVDFHSVGSNVLVQSAGHSTVVGKSSNGNYTLYSGFIPGIDLLCVAPSEFIGTGLSFSNIKWTWIDNTQNETNYAVFNTNDMQESPLLNIDAYEWIESIAGGPNSSVVRYVQVMNIKCDMDSAPYKGYTLIEPPQDVKFGQINHNYIQITAKGSFSHLTRGNSGIYIENLTTGEYSGWVQNTNFWYCPVSDPNKVYNFQVKARNGNKIETITKSSNICTLANHASLSGFSVRTNSLTVFWNDNGNPMGITEYFITNTTTGSNSGWIIELTNHFAGLTNNTSYHFKVKSRNQRLVENSWVDFGNHYTAIKTPAGIQFSNSNDSGIIYAKVTNKFNNLSEALSGIRIYNENTGSKSPWTKSTNYIALPVWWPNVKYRFIAKARNGSGDETGWTSVYTQYSSANKPIRDGYYDLTAFQIKVQWAHNSNPPGTEYFVTNTTTGSNSGWITYLFSVFSNLQPNTTHNFKVKARNFAGVVTEWVDFGDVNTLLLPPVLAGMSQTIGQNLGFIINTS